MRLPLPSKNLTTDIMNFIVKYTTEKNWELLMATLLKMGYVWHRTIEHDTDIEIIKGKWFKNYPTIQVEPLNMNISGHGIGGDYTVDDDLHEILQLALGFASVEINNVAGFRATVTKSKIVVGCQTIPADKFREIMEAVKTVRDN